MVSIIFSETTIMLMYCFFNVNELPNSFPGNEVSCYVWDCQCKVKYQILIKQSCITCINMDYKGPGLS